MQFPTYTPEFFSYFFITNYSWFWFMWTRIESVLPNSKQWPFHPGSRKRVAERCPGTKLRSPQTQFGLFSGNRWDYILPHHEVAFRMLLPTYVAVVPILGRDFSEEERMDKIRTPNCLHLDARYRTRDPARMRGVIFFDVRSEVLPNAQRRERISIIFGVPIGYFVPFNCKTAVRSGDVMLIHARQFVGIRFQKRMANFKERIPSTHTTKDG